MCILTPLPQYIWESPTLFLFRRSYTIIQGSLKMALGLPPSDNPPTDITLVPNPTLLMLLCCSFSQLTGLSENSRNHWLLLQSIKASDEGVGGGDKPHCCVNRHTACLRIQPAHVSPQQVASHCQKTEEWCSSPSGMSLQIVAEPCCQDNARPRSL